MLNNIHLTAYSNNLLKVVSEDITKQFKQRLPDLRNITIFLPNQLTQASLRKEILKQTSKQGYDVVLPPVITTLRQWVRKQQPNKKPVLSQYARELILVDAIKQQPDLFSSANPWGIANELLTLFDEMLLNDIKPVAFNNYYQGNNTELSQALLHESDLVKLLWVAWRNQLSHEDYVDPNEAYVHALESISTNNEDIFYCVEIDQFSKLEANFLNKIGQQSKVLFFAYASSDSCSNRTDYWLKKYLDATTQITFSKNREPKLFSIFLDKVFEDSSLSIYQRAKSFAENYSKSPFNSHLRTFKSNQFETHIKAIDIQVRIWAHENIQNIGIVTTDRKLVRRLRAVLDHANLMINDAAGWALATTSAAVVVEWWIQLIEERYSAKQLLALAHSPFFSVSDPKFHQKAIDYFEKEIVLKFNIHSGIKRYRDALEKLQNKDQTADVEIFNYLLNLLDTFENSAQLLSKLHGSKSYPLHRFINELLNSLKPIGIYTSLHNDEAGKQIIELFENQIAHFKLVDNRMNWSECRRFMSRIFDQQNYKPPTNLSTNQPMVTFCSLEQSRLQNFDALIIASMDKNNFPGASNIYVFFNEQVRNELNIPSWRDDHTRHLHHFRCLLDASEKILITVQTEQNGEPVRPSPWLEAIETFHHMAYNKSLVDPQLEYLVHQKSSCVVKDTDIPPPQATKQPSPVLTTTLTPDKISISQYQNLVNCPYQYFALTCLKLSPTDELQEELNKADFGSLVHQSIHAFFSNVANLPGPFNERITEHNREKAEDLLHNISEKVFVYANGNIDDNDFNIQLWLQRWTSLIPKFIDWEIKRQINFTSEQHETSVHLNIDANFQAYGRLDRVDQSPDGHAIVDYKTGQTPSKVSVMAGEQVQLPMYALLHDADQNTTTSQVEYVAIGDKNTVKSLATIKNDELDELKKQHLSRLQAFFHSLNENTPFTAFANEETCQRCNAFGLCRKDFWSH